MSKFCTTVFSWDQVEVGFWKENVNGFSVRQNICSAWILNHCNLEMYFHFNLNMFIFEAILRFLSLKVSKQSYHDYIA